MIRLIEPFHHLKVGELTQLSHVVAKTRIDGIHDSKFPIISKKRGVIHKKRKIRNDGRDFPANLFLKKPFHSRKKSLLKDGMKKNERTE